MLCMCEVGARDGWVHFKVLRVVSDTEGTF